MAGRTVLDEAIAASGRLGDLHHELADLAPADYGRSKRTRSASVQRAWSSIMRLRVFGGKESPGRWYETVTRRRSGSGSGGGNRIGGLT